MNNMRRGFTMIELIFVIVIIGILAAVALPKLAATRDDAKISNIIANTRTGLGDVTSFYTSKGQVYYENNSTTSEISNIVFKTSSCADDLNATWYPNSHFLCDGTDPCIEFNTATQGEIDINAGTPGTNIVCLGVLDDPVIQTIIAGVHKLGGSNVIR